MQVQKWITKVQDNVTRLEKINRNCSLCFAYLWIFVDIRASKSNQMTNATKSELYHKELEGMNKRRTLAPLMLCSVLQSIHLSNFQADWSPRTALVRTCHSRHSVVTSSQASFSLHRFRQEIIMELYHGGIQSQQQLSNILCCNWMNQWRGYGSTRIS